MKLEHQRAQALQRHPLSAAFPDMPDAELQALVDDIEVEGQRVPIMLFDGKVLDGWHRLRACLRLLLPVEFETLAEDVDPRRWVISQNVSRRHLNASQRAIALAACHRYEWSPRGNPNWGASGISVGPESPISAPGAELRISDSALAAMADVGVRTIQRARAVLSKGSDEVAAAVRDGATSLNVAVRRVQPRTTAQTKAPPGSETSSERPCDLTDDDRGASAAELLDEMRRELELVEAQAKEVLELMAADPDKSQFAAMAKRLHLAERRQAELMGDAAKEQKRAIFFKRQLARCGRAVGQRDITRVASTVEAFVRGSRQAASESENSPA